MKAMAFGSTCAYMRTESMHEHNHSKMDLPGAPDGGGEYPKTRVSGFGYNFLYAEGNHANLSASCSSGSALQCHKNIEWLPSAYSKFEPGFLRVPKKRFGRSFFTRGAVFRPQKL